MIGIVYVETSTRLSGDLSTGIRWRHSSFVEETGQENVGG